MSLMEAPVQKREPKLPMPSGWFRIAVSGELPRKGVEVLEINGQEVVAFRNERGDVTVVDPFCPHMGAHLGYGGRVVDGAFTRGRGYNQCHTDLWAKLDKSWQRQETQGSKAGSF